jgi:hypothetical protein
MKRLPGPDVSPHEVGDDIHNLQALGVLTLVEGDEPIAARRTRLASKRLVQPLGNASFRLTLVATTVHGDPPATPVFDTKMRHVSNSISE